MKKINSFFFIFILLGVNFQLKVFASDDNVHFQGSLVEEPCVVSPGDENIDLDFGSVIIKDLYYNNRTRAQDFAIHLSNCDTVVAKSVNVKFSGTESGVLPGMLALDDSSSASGVAIGLENIEGNFIALNDSTSNTSLVNGENQLHFKAYIQGEPNAITQQNLQTGIFSAQAIFNLIYD
jgi:type 1 fimbria pilin